MIVRTFTGHSLRDALRQVRESFGADAVILDTQFDQSGRNRIGGSVTVTAAHDAEPSEADLHEGAHTLHLRGEIAGGDEAVPPTSVPELTETAPETEPEEEQVPIAEAEEPVADAPRTSRPTTGEKRGGRVRQPESTIFITDDPVWAEFRRWLSAQPQLTAGLIESFTTHLVDALPPFNAFLDTRLKGQVVLFAGARGVGKSTALFKALAARWQTRQRKPQLAVLTPVAETRPDWIAGVCHECDIQYARHALTASRVPVGRPKRGDDLFVEYTAHFDSTQAETQAKALRRGLKPETVVLVLHAGASASAWRAEYARFASLAPTHVLFTHWDEFRPWWEVVAFLRSHPIVGSYCTAGHDPIGDILPLTTSQLQTGLAEQLTGAIGWPNGVPGHGSVHRFATITETTMRKPV